MKPQLGAKSQPAVPEEAPYERVAHLLTKPPKKGSFDPKLSCQVLENFGACPLGEESAPCPDVVEEITSPSPQKEDAIPKEVGLSGGGPQERDGVV